MSSKLAAAAAGLLLCIVPTISADTIGPLPPACTPSPLSSYIALGSAGCSVGHVVFYDFAFSVLTMGGGALPVAASAVDVDPAQIGESYQLKFSSTDFNVSGSEFVSYLLAYTVDPHPILTFEDVLQLNSPVFPGIASVNTDLCLHAPFAGAVCPTSTANVTVFDNGITSQPVDAVAFPPIPPVHILGVRNEILLQANGASSEFSSFTNTVGFVPEPAGWLLAGPALAALLLCRHRTGR